MKNKHYTLVVRRLEGDDTTSSTLAEFPDVLDSLNLGVKAVCLDREFYNSKCLTLLQAHNYTYVIPIIHQGRAIKRELSEGWSRVTQYNLAAKLGGHNWTIEFPVYIDRTYQNGRYDEYGVVHHGYAADALLINSPRDT